MLMLMYNTDLKTHLLNPHLGSNVLIHIYIRSNTKLFSRPLSEPFYEQRDIFLIRLGDFADMWYLHM